MITFIKILPYNLRPDNEDTFTYLTKLGLQTVDPPTLTPNALVIAEPIVFHSPLRRAVECMQKQPTTKYVPMHELREIPFDLAAMCKPSEWESDSDRVVRRAFCDAFINDQLPLRSELIIREVISLLKYCLRESQDVAVLSHSFSAKGH